MARCQWAGGGCETALATLHQGAAWLTQIQIGNLGAHDWLAAQRALLQLWQGELVAALHWEQAIQPAGESPLRYLQQLTRVRIRLAQHAREPQASFLQEATTILKPLLASAEVNGWGSHVIEIRLLQALVEQAQGKRAAAQATLTRALTLAEPAGYIRLFVDEGEAMRLLIAECRVRNAEFSTPLHNYTGKLLAAFGKDKEETKARQVAPPFRTPHSGVPSGPWF